MANSVISNFSLEVDGRLIVNTTPHAITFLSQEGEVVVIPSSVPAGEKASAWVVNARAVEEEAGPDLVRTTFVGSPEGEVILDQIEAWAAENGAADRLRVIGSIIAAQAYPGRVLGMCPAPGFERVPPAEKRMSTRKFTVYTK